MKKILSLTAIGVLLIAPASADYRCLPILANTSVFNGSWSGGANTDTVDWSAGHNLISGGPNLISISGVSYCSSDSPVDIGAINISNISATNGSNCWCKIISPGTTKWFTGGASLENCTSNCASECAGVIREGRSGIIVQSIDWL
ncbi:MAG: hypothetical protein IJX89_02170 [Alphaproteobacteria bacterium]|nr:hypothetical protein [Alphaproteobacteria bacterium]